MLTGSSLGLPTSACAFFDFQESISATEYLPVGRHYLAVPAHLDVLSSIRDFRHRSEEILRAVDFGQPPFLDQPEAVADRANEGTVMRSEQTACLMLQQFGLQRFLAVDASSPVSIPYPPKTNNFHHEIELVVAIGKGGRALRRDR